MSEAIDWVKCLFKGHEYLRLPSMLYTVCNRCGRRGPSKHAYIPKRHSWAKKKGVAE